MWHPLSTQIALQEAVQRMNEAKASLEGVQKSIAEAEAAQAAAEALRPWPSDARLVPSDYPLYPPSTPQRLHPDVATLGSYFFTQSSPGAAHAPSSDAFSPSIRAGVEPAHHVDEQADAHVADTAGGDAGHGARDAERDDDDLKQGMHNGDAASQDAGGDEDMMQGEFSAGSPLPAEDTTQPEHSRHSRPDVHEQVGLTGWQQRLQSGWSEQQLQQVHPYSLLSVHSGAATNCKIHTITLCYGFTLFVQ